MDPIYEAYQETISERREPSVEFSIGRGSDRSLYGLTVYRDGVNVKYSFDWAFGPKRTPPSMRNLQLKKSLPSRHNGSNQELADDITNVLKSGVFNVQDVMVW